MSRTVYRSIGAVLLLLVVLPLGSLAPPAVPGSPAEHIASLARSYYGALLLGGAGIALLALPLAFTRLPRRLGERLGRRAGRLLLAPGSRSFALAAGATSGLLTLLLSRHAFALRPALLDASAQLVHARYLAAGRLSGPELAAPEFFLFQYMVNLPSGWASQYPPGHLALLAGGLAAGVPWLVGPLMVAVAVALTSRVAEELLPEDRAAARLGTALLALSLFFLGHGATYMSHSTAAALGALAVLGGVRGRASGGWALAAGLAAGLAFATRPVAGLVAGCTALAALALPPAGESVRDAARRALRRVPLLAAGSLPPLLALGAYNLRLFGNPTRFGYVAAEGPGHGMGFHPDPWGNPFGPLEGLVRTSRDLLALGLDLLVTPVSAVVVVAAFLLLGPTRPRALPVLLVWALLPLVAHFFYWHQDLFLGPRLLTEFAPPWAILTAVAALGLVRRTRGEGAGRFDLHGWVVGVLLLSAAAGAALLVPQRMALYAAQWGPASRAPVPEVGEPSLVFVPVSWSERLGARLAGRGMRVDSVRMALRHNSSCEVQEFLDGRGGALRFEARAGVEVVEVRVEGGGVVRSFLGERPAPECVRQLGADRQGALGLPELLWQGDLPGLPAEGALFARDLGPELNPRLLELHPGRRPLVHLGPALVPYEAGMRRLWSLPGEPPD